MWIIEFDVIPGRIDVRGMVLVSFFLAYPRPPVKNIHLLYKKLCVVPPVQRFAQSRWLRGYEE